MATDVDTAGSGVTDDLLEKIGSFGLGSNPAVKVGPLTIHPVETANIIKAEGSGIEGSRGQ